MRKLSWLLRVTTLDSGLSSLELLRCTPWRVHQTLRVALAGAGLAEASAAEARRARRIAYFMTPFLGALHGERVRQDEVVAARRPPAEVAIPSAVGTMAAGRPIRAVWENELGGVTFEVGQDAARWHVKWAPAGSPIDLGQEAERLAWAQPFTPVPRVLARGADASGSWLVTAALPGDTAVADRWKADPERAIFAIGHGLRRLHDALPVDPCRFVWSVEHRLADIHRTAGTGRLNPAAWHPVHQALTLERALEILTDAPPVDTLVVCHGDACAPNTLLDDQGHCVGHVDLGALGVADRWADIAATWSTQWNYGPGWEDRLLGAYGIPADPARTAYYRLLWDLGP